MWWLVGVVALLALLSAYLVWTARRVDRLHVRVQAAGRALDAHLLRRAAAAAVVAEQSDHIELYAAARVALDAAPEARQVAENELTRQLRSAPLDGVGAATHPVVAASRRAALACQVHTDLVRVALTARSRPLVRALRMARRHPLPTYFDIVDPTMSVGANGGRPVVVRQPAVAGPTAPPVSPVALGALVSPAVVAATVVAAPTVVAGPAVAVDDR